MRSLGLRSAEHGHDVGSVHLKNNSRSSSATLVMNHELIWRDSPQEA